MARPTVARRTADALANALSDALEEIELWAECSTEGMTPTERKRLRKMQRTLNRYQERNRNA